MSTIRIGMLRLTDAAPVIVAKECGFFAAEGLDVHLSVEPSWANIADKLSFGQLDMAVMLPPLAFAVTLGLRGVGTPLIVPMSLSLNGNTVTLATDLADALGAGGSPLEIGRRLAGLLPSRRFRLRLAVVHVFSTHNLLLRYWLSAAGIDPDRDVELSVVPPADTVRAMRDGHIDGFCAGAPWGAVAAQSGVGRSVVTTSGIWRNHPEKCLGVRRDWADANPALLDGLLTAVLGAAQFCDDSANAAAVAAILAQDGYLALDPAFIRTSLPAADGDPARSVFFANAANYPWRSHAAWLVRELARWGNLPSEFEAMATAIYRPDLFRAAVAKIGLPVPAIDSKVEGAHDAPWLLDGIAMGADLFCDAKLFDSSKIG
jgi:ABC-type nitrate/sulfonate/bicarbonate transport system substrate-binding protein